MLTKQNMTKQKNTAQLISRSQMLRKDPTEILKCLLSTWHGLQGCLGIESNSFLLYSLHHSSKHKQTTRDAVLCTLSFLYQMIQFPVLKQQKCHEMQHSLTLLRTNSTKDSFKRNMCCSLWSNGNSFGG